MDFYSLGVFTVELLTGAVNGHFVREEIRQSVNRLESTPWAVGHEIGLHGTIFAFDFFNRR